MRSALDAPGHARRRRLLAGGIAALAAAGLAAGVATLAHAGRQPAAGPATTLTAVQRGRVTVDVAAAGTVQAAQTRGLSFGLAGSVTQLQVKPGDLVTVGEVLARIDDSAATTAVDGAQTALTSAQDNLTKVQATATATAAATPTPARTCAPSAAPTSHAPSSSPSSRPGSSPGPSPSPSHTPSPARSTAACPTQAAGGGGAAGGGAAGGGGGGGGDPLFGAQQQVNNAQLALWQAQQRLAGTVLAAPIGGKVLAVNGSVGTTETPGSTAFIVLGSVTDIQVRAQFSEADVAAIAIGQAATVTLPNHAEKLTGRVSQIDPAGTASGQLVRYGVLVAFDKPPTELLYGQSANVTVTTAGIDDALYLPSVAVTGVSAGSGTVTVRSSGRDERRTVRVGLRGDQYTQIVSGLSQGDQVVISSGQ